MYSLVFVLESNLISTLFCFPSCPTNGAPDHALFLSSFPVPPGSNFHKPESAPSAHSLPILSFA